VLATCANVDSNKVRVRMEQGLKALEANWTGLGMKMEVCWWSRKKIRTRGAELQRPGPGWLMSSRGKSRRGCVVMRSETQVSPQVAGRYYYHWTS
jgi:hypothetical protein